MDKLYIIKLGGNIIDDDEKLPAFLKKYAAVDEKKILVHGGGKLATRLAEQLKIPQQVVEGRRITDAETLKIVTMVYAGYINKNIVAALQSNSCNAIGLCGADGDAILAHKRKHPVMDYGFVGDVDMVNTGLIIKLLNAHLSPVFAPITHDQQGQLLNTNADTIAQELAVALASDYEVILVYLFEKNGVLQNSGDENSVIPEIRPSSYHDLRSAQLVFGGMIPKLDNAFTALRKGVSKIILGNGEQLPELIKGRTGTAIINE
jgi:acetylglutamate kinase